MVIWFHTVILLFLHFQCHITFPSKNCSFVDKQQPKTCYYFLCLRLTAWHVTYVLRFGLHQIFGERYCLFSYRQCITSFAITLVSFRHYCFLSEMKTLIVGCYDITDLISTQIFQLQPIVRCEEWGEESPLSFAGLLSPLGVELHTA